MLARPKSAISLGVSALIVIAIIVIAGFRAYLDTTFNTTSTTIISSTSSSSSSHSLVTSTTVFTPSLNGICLDEMPANATLTNFQNSSFLGYEVSMTNGTTSYLP